MGRRLTPDAVVTRTIRRASVAAAGISVVFSPVPLVDELVLAVMYTGLTVRVAHARGKNVREVPWRPLVKTALVGLVVRGVLDAPAGQIPGLTTLVNATSAVALTRIYGDCVDYVCTRRPEATGFGPRDVLAAIRARRTRGAAAAASSPA